MSPAWLIPVVAYLLGSIPFGLLIVKALGGPDIRADRQRQYRRRQRHAQRRETRRHPHAAARRRQRLPRRLARQPHSQRDNIRWMMIAAVCAVVGHMFPVWLGFNGGKGVATGLGVFVADLLASRRCWDRSVAARGSFLALFVARLDLRRRRAASFHLPALRARPRASGNRHLWHASSSRAGPLKHRANIERLIAGEEPRLGAPRKKDEYCDLAVGFAAIGSMPHSISIFALPARLIKSQSAAVAYQPTPVLSSRCFASHSSLAFY